MTDEHQVFFADLYNFFEKYEQPPPYSDDEPFKMWWAHMMDDAQALAAKYNAIPSALEMIFGVIDGIQDEYKARQKGDSPT